MSAHYHVNTSTGGYLNDTEVYCVNTLELASTAMIREINALAGIVHEGCDRDGCRVCGWCRAFRQIQRESAFPKVSGPVYRIETATRGVAVRGFDAPVGPELVVWMEQLDADRTDCDNAIDA